MHTTLRSIVLATLQLMQALDSANSHFEALRVKSTPPAPSAAAAKASTDGGMANGEAAERSSGDADTAGGGEGRGAVPVGGNQTSESKGEDRGDGEGGGKGVERQKGEGEREGGQGGYRLTRGPFLLLPEVEMRRVRLRGWLEWECGGKEGESEGGDFVNLEAAVYSYCERYAWCNGVG